MTLFLVVFLYFIPVFALISKGSIDIRKEGLYVVSEVVVTDTRDEIKTGLLDQASSGIFYRKQCNLQ